MGRTATADVKRIKRKHGYIVRLEVEIDATQYERFRQIFAELGLSKTDAVQQALEIWMGTLPVKVGS